MLIIVEKSCLFREHYLLVRSFAQLSPWFKELSLLDVAPMDFVELPVVAIGVNYSGVLYHWVNIAHVLQTP